MRHQSLLKMMMLISIVMGMTTTAFSDEIQEIEAMKQFLFNGTDIATVKLQEKRQEWECRMVTRYRDEDYSCQVPVQVPYQVTIVTDASVDFNFDNFGDDVNSLFTIKLENGKTSLKVKDQSATPYYIFSRHEDQVTGSGDLERTVESVHNVFYVSQEKVLSPIKSKIELKDLKKKSLTFSMGEIFFDKSVKVSLVIKKKDDMVLSTLLDLRKAKVEVKEGKSFVTVNLSDYNVELKRGWGRKYDLTFKVIVEPQLIHRGRLLMDLSRTELTKEASFKKKKPSKN